MPSPPRNHTPERLSTFYPFSRLPIELRTKIWQYTMVSRFVSLAAKHKKRLPQMLRNRWNPRYCLPNCAEHGYHEPFPTVLHVCHESRREGLRLYHLFETADTPFTAGFKCGYVNFKVDTLQQKTCYHIERPRMPGTPGYLVNGSTGRSGSNQPLRWFPFYSMISALAGDEDKVASVKSLAVCACEALHVGGVHNFQVVVKCLMKFRSLRELIFMRIATDEILEHLGSDRQPVDGKWAAEERAEERVEQLLERSLPSHENIIPRNARHVMLHSMYHVYWLEHQLRQYTELNDCSWRPPKLRCVLMKEGEIVWEANFSQECQGKIVERIERLRHESETG